MSDSILDSSPVYCASILLLSVVASACGISNLYLYKSVVMF